jgi:acyl-CoA thioester hydrolase
VSKLNNSKKNQFEFIYSLRVRYSEVDLQGLVFNANYLNYIDVAIGEYFRSKNISYKDFVKQYSIDFHVIKSVLEYKYGAQYDDELDICIRGEYQRSKIFWFIEIYRSNTLICSGELVYLAIDTEKKKVIKIKPEIANMLNITRCGGYSLL